MSNFKLGFIESGEVTPNAPQSSDQSTCYECVFQIVPRFNRQMYDSFVVLEFVMNIGITSIEKKKKNVPINIKPKGKCNKNVKEEEKNDINFV